ncbi:hypothetical protein [Pseudonocardia sp.]|jgi:hypothetical protein|uniref:hypothetical protein n=1 Tax=Pseudonocardia sp. TaxID=60912 RepID=UPI003D0F3E69
MAEYQPPEQSRRGQLVDAATILVLLFATLFVTTFLVQDTATGADAAAAERPVAEMPVNPAERRQYQALIDSGATDLATVNAAIDSHADRRDKYAINVWALLGTAALLAIYLAFVYRTSFREYREVIEERFGPSERERTP